MILNQSDYIRYRQNMARNLLELAKEHKKNCQRQNCNISIWVIGEIYKELVCRELTPEEIQLFI